MEYYTRSKKYLSNKHIGVVLAEGTIYTPIELVEEILDKLNIDWSNPALTFLDPACGRGTFLYALKNRLMKAGHTEQWIVENMLFGVDIEEKNTAFASTLIGAGGKYRTNIECCDALTKDWNMKFDVVLTNPPYERDIYKKFVEFATELAPEVAAITPSVFLTGSKGKNFRKFLAGKNVKAVDVLPIGLFKNVKDDGTVKDMLMSVSVTYITAAPQSEVAMSRAFGDLVFKWTDNFTELGDDLHYYLGEEGKSIFSKAEKYVTKFDTSTAVQHKHVEWVGPNVNLTEKIDLNYVVTPAKLAKATGKLWNGKVVDADGTWDAIREKDTPSNKRYVYKTETAEQAINLGKWMDSRLFGVLLMMTSTNANVSQSTAGKIPYIVLDGDYTDQRVYDLLGLTPAEVTWVENLGKQ